MVVRTKIGAGVSRYTGKPLDGWEHTVACIDAIFQTPFSTRVLRRWFGSFVPSILGRNIDPPTILMLWTSVYAALYFEPRFQLTNIELISSADDARAGHVAFLLTGVYLPRAHLGDQKPSGPKKISLVASADGFIARPA